MEGVMRPFPLRRHGSERAERDTAEEEASLRLDVTKAPVSYESNCKDIFTLPGKPGALPRLIHQGG